MSNQAWISVNMMKRPILRNHDMIDQTIMLATPVTLSYQRPRVGLGGRERHEDD